MQDIYQFFACTTHLPVKIDSVLSFLRDRGLVQHVNFYEVDIDSNILWAQFRAYDPYPYASEPTYEIHYSKHLTDAQKRLACCKELLHVLDEEVTMASSQEEVETLVKEMTIPPHSGISPPTSNDHSGIIRALLILVPRDCLQLLKPAYDGGEISAEEVAAATGLPVEYARLTLQDFWRELVHRIR